MGILYLVYPVELVGKVKKRSFLPAPIPGSSTAPVSSSPFTRHLFRSNHTRCKLKLLFVFFFPFFSLSLLGKFTMVPMYSEDGKALGGSHLY